MWELATGLPPWHKCTDETIIEALVQKKARSNILLDIPQEYKQIIDDAWNQDSSKRPSYFDLMERMNRLMRKIKQRERLSRSIAYFDYDDDKMTEYLRRKSSE